MYVAVHTSGDPLQLLPSIRAELRRMDKALPIYDAMPLAKSVDRSLGRPRDNAAVLALFAALALVLTAVGLYGVIAYSAAQRTHEIGIRMALGAGAAEVIRNFVRHGLLVACSGITLGIAGAIGTARLIRSLLFGASPDLLVTLLTGASLLLAVAFAASYIPARRATKVDPMAALRYE